MIAHTGNRMIRYGFRTHAGGRRIKRAGIVTLW